MTLSADRAREVLVYDQDSGMFVWRIRRGQRGKVGELAGGINGNGYWSIRVDGRNYAAHRLAWLIVRGEWPENEIDHINGIRTDNRWINLRDVTKTVNVRNQRGPHANSTTGFAGVTRKKNGSFYAHITVNGIKRHVGSFNTAEAASLAYQQAKHELHPN